MFLEESSDSPHDAYVAYLDRFSNTESQIAEEAGTEDKTSEGARIGDGFTAGTAILSEEAFCSHLASLDELALREMEGRLSTAHLELMRELQALLLCEPPEDWERDSLPHVAERNHAEFRSRETNQPKGARLRRDRWRQLRREDRSAGE